jgi:uncharacterized protein (TIGR02231 family)
LLTARDLNPNLMKKIIVALMVLFYVHASAQSEVNVTNSQIKNVKVFLSGAQIERIFSTTIENGVSQIAVENLSTGIDANSISVSGSGDATVLSTSFSPDYLKENRESAVVKRLKDSLENMNNNMNELNMYKSVYNDELSMLNANKSIGGSNTGVSAENLQRVIDFFRQRSIDLKTKLITLDQKITKLSDKIKKINEQIDVENGKFDQPSGTIFITMSAKQRTTVNLELSYYASGASWKPAYDMKAVDVNGPVSLIYKANVAQQTGENWNNVHVFLSTGNPSLGATKPNMTTWFLRYYTPPVYRTEGLYEKSMAPAAAESKQKDIREISDDVAVQQNQIVTEFEIKIPYTVKSDGKIVQMDIQSSSLPANYTYYSAPKLDKDAFLVAYITGWESLNLLPGPAKVYLENTYTGTSYINPASATDTLSLSFGRDKRIIISREKVKDLSNVTFISGNVEKEFTFETTIRNTKKDKIEITIEDQIPLSTDESIKVTAGNLSGGTLNTETGIIRWKINLGSAEYKKIRLSYKVKYPKDKVIQGL